MCNHTCVLSNILVMYTWTCVVQARIDKINNEVVASKANTNKAATPRTALIIEELP